MNRIITVIFLLSLTYSVSGQDDLMNLLDSTARPEINFTTATFKSTRIVNGHSIERMKHGQLDFRISHRFGTLNSGAYNFFGMDQATIHLGLEYGITDWLMVGIGRGSYEKTVDGSAKFSILRQSSGARVMPVSVSLFSSIAVNGLKWSDPTRTNYFSSRLSYTNQVLVGRKFNNSFSFQLTPTMVHRNLVATLLDPNDLWAMGAGGRIKLTKRISINGEYYYIVNKKNYMSQPTYDPLSIGIDIETGGHVFQIILTNSTATIEKGFISETTGKWLKGDIHIGFNISRVFNLNKTKKVN
ncbi:MAG TPA: DUF5777 family beta-barrel protein [Bacteroidales bacterium]|nr:DUF5777 family beta-barrel protein [Bacteroidales bacterium]